jgi:sulfate transport system ATP-binding protein
VTSLLVTHDQEEALELANEVVVMHQGRIEQVGTAEEVYNRPATPFVAGFVGSANVLRGSVWEGHVHFGRSAVAGAHHLEDGAVAVAYVRPHDVALAVAPGSPMAFPVQVERRTDLGWASKVHLRLADGQELIAQLPNEELMGILPGRQVFANLRNAKVFTPGGFEPVGDQEEMASA